MRTRRRQGRRRSGGSGNTLRHRAVAPLLATLAVIGIWPMAAGAQDPTTPDGTETTTTTTTSPLPATADALVQGPVALVVPTPGATQSVITVKVGGNRTATGGVTPQAGVTLQLVDTQTGTTGTTFVTPNTCVSDADGDCNWTVNNTGTAGGSNANRDRRFWVRQINPVGPSTYTNAQLNVGPNTGPWPATNYRFQTCTQLRGGQTCSSQATGANGFMLATTASNEFNASGGIWQTSRDNAPRTARCGLRVALILDLSGSVGAQIGNLRAAATTFVNAVVGTPSAVGLFTFASNGPANTTNNQNRPLTSVSTTAGANTVNGWINGVTVETGNSQFTNWDRALNQVTQSSQFYDIAIVITDGNPTAYGGDAVTPPTFQSDGRTRFREIENGVFSANGLKAKGTRIIGFGVGAGVSGSGLNLSSISGQTLNTDYFQTADYAAAGALLRSLAQGTCTGSVSIIKQVIPPGGTTANAAPAPGWTFGATTSTSGVTINPANAITDATGGVNFALTFPGGVTQAGVTVTETDQAGYTLVQQGGFNASCRRIDTGAAIPVTNSGALGFQVTTPFDAPTSCTVYNQAPNPPATVQVDKLWTVNGVSVPDGQQPSGLSTHLTIAGTNHPFGVPVSGFVAGQTVTLDETVTNQLPLCTVTSRTVTLANGSPPGNGALPFGATLIAGANTFQITNVVTCTSNLELAKAVVGGPEPPTSWNLRAIAPAGAIAGPNGSTGVKKDVTPGVIYALAETGGNPNYVQDDLRGAPVPGSTGTWRCVVVDANGIEIPGFSDGINGGVTVPLGQRVRCTATNRTARLILRKVVTNSFGGTASSPAWTLTATPTGTPPAGVVAQSVTGSIEGTAIYVRPGQEYALTETGPGAPAYALSSIECVIDPAPIGTRTAITLAGGDSATCTYTNVDQPAQLTLRKVVDNGTTGATATPSSWTLSAAPVAIPGQALVTGNGDPTNAGGVNARQVFAGAYDLSESTIAGYVASAWSCTGAAVTGSRVVVTNGAAVECTITNTATQPRLTLIKTVDNGAGAGDAVPGAWTLSAAGPTPITGATGSEAVTDAAVAVGTYDLSEAGPGGYTPSSWSCTGGTSTATSVSLALGQSATCTINNVAIAPRLTLIKTVVNQFGGTAVAADWTLSATGPTSITGVTGSAAVTDAVVGIGTYDLTESVGPVGYVASVWSCTGATPIGNQITLGSGAVATCTITNSDAPAKLTLQKIVNGGPGGTTRVAAEWTLRAVPDSIPGQSTVSGNGDPLHSGGVDARTVFSGRYALDEIGPIDFTASDWTCTGGSVTSGRVTVPVGGTVRCFITNTAVQPLLTLVKQVDNGNGAGDALATDFTLTAANGPTVISGVTGSIAVTTAPVTIGTYSLSETGPSGYTPSSWTCIGATATPDSVTLVEGSVATCTITNTAVAPRLTLVKTVTNDNGGTAVPTDWTLAADGPTTISGATGSTEITNAPVPVGTYDLTETGPAGYTPAEWTCVGATANTAASVTLSVGETATCTINNDDQAGSWTLAKASDPTTGSVVQPGATITYTVAATKTGDIDPIGLTVTDDLVGVLSHATLDESSIIASTGTASFADGELTWTIPRLSDPVDPSAPSATLTYRVTVNADAFGATLTNVVSGTGTNEPPTDCAAPTPAPEERASLARAVGGKAAVADADTLCTTSHNTPPPPTTTTTTTAPPTTTTTAPAVVEGAVETQATPDTPAVEGSELAGTGSESANLIGLSLLLVALGLGVLTVVFRRRR